MTSCAPCECHYDGVILGSVLILAVAIIAAILIAYSVYCNRMVAMIRELIVVKEEVLNLRGQAQALSQCLSCRAQVKEELLKKMESYEKRKQAAAANKQAASVSKPIESEL